MLVYHVIEKLDDIEVVIRRLRGELDLPVTDECKNDAADLLEEYSDMIKGLKVEGLK